MNWREIQLGDAIHVKHGFAFKGQHFSDSGAYVVLTPGNFNEEGGFRLRPGKDRYYIGDIPEDYILDEDDLIVAMTEQGPGLLGSSALIPEGDQYLHNQRLGLVQILDDLAFDKQFFYYLFNTRTVRGQISGSATGTKVRHTAPERIYRVKASVPSNVAEQKKIGVILSAYDDLIENNRRRIQLLEQAARLLYKEWFVHLRFPGHEHAKIKDGIPEGWEKKLFPDVVEFKEGPGLRNYQYREQGIPFLNIRTFNDDEIDMSKTKCIDETEVVSKYEHFLLDEDDHVVSSSGTLGRVVTIRKCHLPVMLNTSLIRMRPKGEMRKWFLKAHLKYGDFIDQATAMATGAAQLNYGPSHLKVMSILVPNPQLIELFEEHVSASYTQIKLLLDSNLRLVKARDLLLPRLMNGQVAV